MKLGNSIFRKMLFSGFLVIVVSLLIMDFYLTRYMADQQTEAVEQRLTAQARVLAGELDSISGRSNPLPSPPKSGPRRASPSSIPRGTVLADSPARPRDAWRTTPAGPRSAQARQGRAGSLPSAIAPR